MKIWPSPTGSKQCSQLCLVGFKPSGTDTHLHREGFHPGCVSLPALSWGMTSPWASGTCKATVCRQSYCTALHGHNGQSRQTWARFRPIPGIEPYRTFTAFLKVICKTNVSIKIRMETCTKFFLLTGCGGHAAHKYAPSLHKKTFIGPEKSSGSFRLH